MDGRASAHTAVIQRPQKREGQFSVPTEEDPAGALLQQYVCGVCPRGYGTRRDYRPVNILVAASSPNCSICCCTQVAPGEKYTAKSTAADVGPASYSWSPLPAAWLFSPSVMTVCTFPHLSRTSEQTFNLVTVPVSGKSPSCLIYQWICQVCILPVLSALV